MTVKAISLCSGVGGLDLAAEWAGVETVALCERDAYCRSILALRFPTIPIFEDIADVTCENLRARGIDPTHIDLLYGGIPCQDNSVAGKRLGRAGSRNLWPQTFRLIREIKPQWVLVENVGGLLSVNVTDEQQPGGLFGDILRDLAQAGYRTGWDVLGACDVGAPHKRERVVIFAYRATGVGLANTGRLGRQRGRSDRNRGHLPGDGKRLAAQSEPQRHRRKHRVSAVGSDA